MTAPIALQLYSVREELQNNFEDTLEQIAAMGYEAVEAGAFAGDARRQARAYADQGLTVVAAHMPPPVGENRQHVLDEMGELGCTSLVVPWLDPQRYYQAVNGVRAAADLLNEAAAVCQDHGLRLLYHNHDFEFARIDGTPAFGLLVEALSPDVFFEVDTYWVQTAGSDAAEVVRGLGERAPLLHIKDGPLQRDQPMVAVGDGQMDFRSVISAGEPYTEWLIVELDRCAGDMMAGVARSLDYLKTLQLT